MNRPMTITKERSAIIDNMKAWCIFSVVCAHTSGSVSSEGGVIRWSCLLNLLGTMGVPIFFLLSGILFKYKEESIKNFIKRKSYNLAIPWIFTGTIVWLYVVLRKGGIHFISWLKFVLGDGSYLYYMSMLLVCYILFYGKKIKLSKVVILTISSGIWLALECMRVVHSSNPYMNPLNWIVYFGIGVLLGQYELLDKILEGVKQFKYFIIIVWILFVVEMANHNVIMDYWHKWFWVFEVLSFVMMLCLPLMSKNVFGFTEIGKQSYPIYLLHMPVAGVVNFLFTRLNIENFLILKPIAVIAIMMTFIKILQFVERKTKCNGKIIACLGIK